MTDGASSISSVFSSIPLPPPGPKNKIRNVPTTLTNAVVRYIALLVGVRFVFYDRETRPSFTRIYSASVETESVNPVIILLYCFAERIFDASGS